MNQDELNKTHYKLHYFNDHLCFHTHTKNNNNNNNNLDQFPQISSKIKIFDTHL